MSAISPNGIVWLIKDVPFSPNYFHEIIDFDSSNSQIGYMTAPSRVVLQLGSQNYIKTESGKIRVEANADVVEDVTYMAWDNADIDTEHAKMVYAFVTNIDLVSANVVEISYEVDVFQTYVVTGRVSFKNCLIERKTPTTDTKYLHLEPEPVGFSEYKLEKLSSLIVNTGWKWVVFAPFDITDPPDVSSFNPAENISYEVKMNGMAGGVLQGLWSYAYDSYTQMESDIQDMDSRLAEQIVAIVAIPAGFIGSGSLGVIQPNIKDENTTLPSSIDGYTNIKYNKLWSYPFNSMLLCNTHGSTRQLRFEYFQDPEHISFHLVLGISASPEMFCCPNYYGHGFVSGNKPNYLESVNITDFPHVAWTGDGFKAWFGTSGQHAITGVIGNIASGVVAGILNPATIPGSVAGLVSGVANSAVDMANAGITKNKSYGNTGGSLALMADGAVNFYVYQQCINRNDAERIDDYFSRFGYAINKIQTPNMTIPTGRNQKYIKTTGCLIVGDCPSEYIRKIQNIFDKGVTMWRESKLGTYN